MGSRIIIFSLVFGLLVLIIPAFLALGIKMIPNDFQASFDDSQKVYKDREISQNFIADKDYLSGLGVSIRNLNLMNKKDIVMSLRKENNLIREVALNGGVIGDGQLVKFIFDPITDSKGQTYKLVFSAGDSNIDEALEIFLTKSFPGASVTKKVWRVFFTTALKANFYLSAGFIKVGCKNSSAIYPLLSFILCLYF